MRAIRDNVELERDDARELWEHFSAWMDEHPGDLAGFAAALGVTSVRPALDAKGAVLVVSTTEAQSAYANAGRIDAAKKREKGAAPSHADPRNPAGRPGATPRKGKGTKPMR